MSSYLVEHFFYKREDMVILTDDQQNPMSQPTKQNILRAMHWLVKDAKPNDSLFLHYSGELGSIKSAHKSRKVMLTQTPKGTEDKPKTSTATKTTATTK